MPGQCRDGLLQRARVADPGRGVHDPHGHQRVVIEKASAVCAMPSLTARLAALRACARRRRGHRGPNPRRHAMGATVVPCVRDRHQPLPALRRSASWARRDHRPGGDRGHPDPHGVTCRTRPTADATLSVPGARPHRRCAPGAPRRRLLAREPSASGPRWLRFPTRSAAAPASARTRPRTAAPARPRRPPRPAARPPARCRRSG